VHNVWVLTMARIRLAMRNRAFLFFSLLMPMLFLFGAVMMFGQESRAWVPYILGAILTFTVMGSFWGLSVQLVTFREQGILRRFRLAPVGAGAMLASSILSNYFMTVPTVALELVVCRFAFHMQSWGNVGAIFVLVTFGSVAFSSFGLIVASVTNTMQETQMINNLIWTGFIFLSGATIPVATLPGWIQRIALFLPATYLATGLEWSTSNLVTMRELFVDILALAVGIFVAFEISRQLFRWEPEAKVPGRAKLWVLAAMVPFLLFGTYENLEGTRLKSIKSDFRAIQMRAAMMRAQQREPQPADENR
jgi:uncharacterized membrane protein YecN with MAPEG domain